MRGIPGRRGLVLGLGAAVVASGAAGLWRVTGDAEVVVVDDEVSMLVNPRSYGAQQAALISGRLAVIGGDCLGLSSPGGSFPDEEHVLLFPHGTTAAPGGRGIVTPDGATILVGEELSGGGGVREIDRSDDWLLGRWPTAPSGCLGADAAAGLSTVEP
jgi:hypothetical protein